MSATFPISDLRLKELAEEPVSDLFPVMTVGTVFSPWIVLLAFLPCLPGLLNWTLDERSAAWGLRTLDLIQPPGSDHPAAMAGETDAPTLKSAPRLATWLTAITLSGWPSELPWSLMLVSYLSVAGTIIAAARLSRRFGVDRLACLTALCCAGCPLLLNSAHLAGPEPLGLCLMTVALERFLAHLDGSVGAWSGRLFCAGLAWGGSWLAVGWPALILGAALAIHAQLFAVQNSERGGAADFNRAGRAPMQNYRRSVVVFWIIGLAAGGWSLWSDIRDVGLVATTAWLFDPTPHAASPLFPDSAKIAAWGAGAGFTFLWGWIVLGGAAMLRGQPRVLSNNGDGRAMVLLVWWAGLIVCRVVVAASGGDPTSWDILQTVPACLTAAIGMETVIERRAGTGWLAAAIAIGLASLALFVPKIDTVAVQAAFALGAVICLGPVARNLWEARSFQWRESQTRRALRGLVLGTWAASLTWGAWQTIPMSRVDARLSRLFDTVRDDLSSPGAVIVVSPDAPTRSLVFQIRRHWPEAALVTADRWEAAISRTLSAVDDWADAEFLVVELTPRDSQFRRPAAGWIVRPVGEPRRYYGNQLTLHTVSIQSP